MIVKLRLCLFIVVMGLAYLGTVVRSTGKSSNATIGVGFGTAALGNQCYQVVLMALEYGFRKFDTAEESDYWYKQAEVGSALRNYFTDKMVKDIGNDECMEDDVSCGGTSMSCMSEDLQISTKISPWSLTSAEDIRTNAKNSRNVLLGFCEPIKEENDKGETLYRLYPLDVYYIHAPRCWDGWHPRCINHPPTLELRDAWLAMEAVVGLDQSAQRIGLSNVSPQELFDIIQFVRDRKARGEMNPPPRIPDVIQAFADPLAPSEELRQICMEYGIEFVSYSTLGTQHRGYPSNPVLTNPIVQSLSTKHERSVAEVVLSWALQRDMSVIPRSSQRNHIEELARLLNPHQSKFLTEEELYQIDSMSKSRAS